MSLDATEVIGRTRVEIDNTKFCYVTISRYRGQRYRETVTCNQKKSSEFVLKKGLDKESSSNTEMEFGINFGPVAAKLNQKTGTKITSITEQTTKHIIP